MQSVLRLTATVQSGGLIEIRDSQLTAGDAVNVIVLLPGDAEPSRRSVVEVLSQASGKLAFQTADEVDAYVREERDAWAEGGHVFAPMPTRWSAGFMSAQDF